MTSAGAARADGPDPDRSPPAPRPPRAAGQSVPGQPTPGQPSSSQPTSGPQPRVPRKTDEDRSTLSIGDVLGELKGDYPDVTISKIRFLENEGLIEPHRSASGYRKFSRSDVARLRYVLSAQRDRYLPLRVIKDQLAALDRGLEPGDGGAFRPRPMAVDEGPRAEDFLMEPAPLRLSRDELLAASGLDESQLTDLEQYGLLSAQSGGHFDGNALGIAQTVALMAGWGIEARHLRPFKTAADREIGLVAQVVSPLARTRSAEARAQAVGELAALSVRLHAALVRAGLQPGVSH